MYTLEKQDFRSWLYDTIHRCSDNEGWCKLSRTDILEEYKEEYDDPDAKVKKVVHHIDVLHSEGKLIKGSKGRFGLSASAPDRVSVPAPPSPEKHKYNDVEYSDLPGENNDKSTKSIPAHPISYYGVRFVFLVFMIAQTMHTFEFLHCLTGGAELGFWYAIVSAVAMDAIFYVLVISGERHKVGSLLAFYAVSNIYAFNFDISDTLVISLELLMELVKDLNFWCSLFAGVYLPQMAHRLSEVIWKDNINNLKSKNEI